MFYAADTDGDGDVSETTRRSLPFLCLEACRSQRMLPGFSLLSLQVDREEFEVLKPKLRRYAAEKASAEFPRQWEVFQELDEDGTGTLSTDEVFDFLAGKDESVANDLMTELDQNHDGALPPPPRA